MGIAVGVIAIIFALYLYLIITKKAPPKCRCQTKLDGKTVLITGGNSGIGYKTSLELARRKAKVILACRNVESAQKTADKIKDFTGNDEVYVREVDLNSLASVRSFVDKFIKEEPRLDILINNAGVTDGTSRWITKDGLEHTMAVNYFSPFLLTNLLLDLLQKSKGRIINVTSTAHKFISTIDLDKLNEAKSDMGRKYYESKLCVNLFTRKLANKLKDTGVTVNCLHPGTTNTGLFRSLPFFVRLIFKLLRKLDIIETVEDCSQTSLHLCLSCDLENTTGEYFERCQIAKPNPLSLDEEVGVRLWEISKKLTGLET